MQCLFYIAKCLLQQFYFTSLTDSKSDPKTDPKSDPKSDPQSCGPPDSISHGSFSGTYDVGDSVIYVCNDGYKSESGSMTRTCQKDGTWDGVKPTCVSSELINFTMCIVD